LNSPAPDTPNSLLSKFLVYLEARRFWFFAAIGLLYVAGYNGQDRIGDDSSYYLAVGQSIAQGEGYTCHGEPETIAMPLVPYLLGLCLKVSPTHGVSLALGVLLAGGLVSLVLAYQLFLLYVPRVTAVLALIFFAANNQVYGVHYRLLTEAPYLLGVVATFLGYAHLTRGSLAVGSTPTQAPRLHPGLAWVLFLLGLAVATTSRIVMLALFFAIGVACVWRVVRAPRQATHYLVAAGSWAVFIAFYLLDPRKSAVGYTQTRTYEAGLWRYATELGDTLHRSMTVFLPDLVDPTIVEGTFGFDPALPAALVLSALALVFVWVGCGKRPLWWAFVAANFGMMLVFGSVPRYIIPIAFIVHLGGAVLVMRLAYCKTRHHHWTSALGAVLILLSGLMNTITSIGFLIDQRSPDFYQVYKDGKFANLPQTVEALEQQLPEGAIVVAPKGRMLTFYSQHEVFTANEVVKTLGGEAALARLRERGELFVLLPGEEMMGELLARPGVGVGPEIATIPHWDIEEPPLSLHRLTYDAGEVSSSP